MQIQFFTQIVGMQGMQGRQPITPLDNMGILYKVTDETEYGEIIDWNSTGRPCNKICKTYGDMICAGKTCKKDKIIKRIQKIFRKCQIFLWTYYFFTFSSAKKGSQTNRCF